ncbi:MAG TPA: N-acetylmuramoyl-L-alanine amidase [Devosiaceae bacterium]|nr:N-acetylmuramoyl-L-alanine amidase [Devosiaceae bacterium]
MRPNRHATALRVPFQMVHGTAAFNALLAALLILITLSLPLAARAAEAAALPDVLAARVTTTPERARLILDLSAPTQFAVVTLANPDRIAVDARAGSLKFDTPQPTAGAGLVTNFTVSLFGGGRARALLSLAGPAQVQQAYVLDAFGDQPARLVVDLIPDTPEAFAKRAAADAAAAAGAPAAMGDNSTPPGQSTAVPAPAASTAPGAAASGTGDAAPSPAAQAAASPQQSPPAASPARGAASKARPLIILDPGHGGIDSGARANGTMEKDITLAFSRKLEALLTATGRFDVALTRTDDTYLTLEQRVALARENKADLFISLHADTFAQPQIHGTSIYTRDEQATDVLDKVLADHENKSDIVAGYAVPKMTPQVVNVLVDLMRRQMRRQSFAAAEAIIDALQPSFALRRFPVRQADFFVLQAPDVPSMLIELGFLSNHEDIGNLLDPKWQDRAAAAIARGISSYFDETQGQDS